MNPLHRLSDLQHSKTVRTFFLSLFVSSVIFGNLLCCNLLTAFAREIESPSFYYKVKKGDTLGGIALRRKVSMKALREWNNLTEATR
jgi:LysM repeat protein